MMDKRKGIKIDDILLYETPSITEFISINWMQKILVAYIGFKVNRKIKRYNKRIRREIWVENYNKNNGKN